MTLVGKRHVFLPAPTKPLKGIHALEVLLMADKIRCAHILVKTEADAKLLQAQLATGASFTKLAQEKSTCPSGKNGGDLGVFGRGQMVREFEKAAFALDKGQMTQAPVKTEFGWHIIKRLE